LVNVTPIATSQIPKHHYEFATECIVEYLQGKRITPAAKKPSRYDLAILYNPEEKFPPSNKKALQRFIKAGEALGFNVELIQRGDIGRLFEFDALLIRETTSVNHHTYRFARKAKANGLEVIDDPESILKCCNKVYLAELLEKHQIPIPETRILGRDDVDAVVSTLTYPCILKQPDSCFSRGVVKVDTPEEFREQIRSFFAESDLVIVQEFLPTPFDWRIGILNGEPLFAAKYFMAKNHWQIYNHSKKGVSAGNAITYAIEDAPKHIVKTALRAAQLIGDGFYGVDLKEVDGKCVVIEINDNPSIDAGIEDEILGDALYMKILETMAERLDNSRNAAAGIKKSCVLV
jgi:glutathione synthase/RimK-type ligase-like ATP-grasp enzyme